MKINYLFNNQLLKIITFDRIGMHYLGYVQPLTGLWVAVGNHLRATDMEALTGLGGMWGRDRASASTTTPTEPILD